VCIRLKRLGRRNRAHWRICATDKRAARDGRVIEELGSYDPQKPNQEKIQIDRERVKHWLKVGATPSETVAQLLGHAGIDGKGNEVQPRPWRKRKRQAPPPPAAQRIAEEQAKAAAGEPAADAAQPASPAAEAKDAPAPPEGA